MGKKRDPDETRTDAELIDALAEELQDWRGAVLTTVRASIKAADPQVVEEWKWGGPVWSHDGIVCTFEPYKAKVKLTFLDGAALDDPAGLFTSSLDGNKRRAIDVHEGEQLDETAFAALIRSAVAHNEARASAR